MRTFTRYYKIVFKSGRFYTSIKYRSSQFYIPLTILGVVRLLNFYEFGGSKISGSVI